LGKQNKSSPTLAKLPPLSYNIFNGPTIPCGKEGEREREREE